MIEQEETEQLTTACLTNDLKAVLFRKRNSN